MHPASERVGPPDTLPSEAMLRRLAEATSDLLTVLGADARILWASESWRGVMGYDPRALEGTPALDLLHPEDLGEARAGLDRVEAEGSARAVVRVRAADGAWRWHDVKAYALPAGQFGRAIAVARDVTLEREADHARALLAAIVRDSDDAIVSKDLRGVVTSWNQGAERIFGYTAKEAIGRPLAELIIPAHLAEEEAEILRRIRAGGRVDHYETRRRRKDGTLLDISVTISPIRDASGRVVGASKVARDVGAQKESAERLRASEERLRALLLQSPISTQIIAPDGRTVEANPAFYQLWGITPDVIADYNILQDEQLERKGILPHLLQAFGGEAARVPPVRYDPAEIGKPGRARWVRAVVYPVKGPRGEVREVVIQHEDVTDQTTAEEGLREANERLRASEEARARLVNMAAHELKTPLTPLKLQVMLLRSWQGNLTPQQQGALAMLERNVARLDQLVDDVLDAVRLQGGRLRFDFVPLDLNRVVAEALETYQEVARASGVDLGLTLGPSLPVRGDAPRLAQVLFNLLGNALKFTLAGGAIHVTTDREGGQAVVRVEDTGIGLAPEDLPVLFQPFGQVRHFREGTRVGSGLGLYISKGVVEQHGGTIRAESRGPGKGATFTFTLPLTSDPIAESPPRLLDGRAGSTLAQRLREAL